MCGRENITLRPLASPGETDLPVSRNLEAPALPDNPGQSLRKFDRNIDVNSPPPGSGFLLFGQGLGPHRPAYPGQCLVGFHLHESIQLEDERSLQLKTMNRFFKSDNPLFRIDIDLSRQSLCIHHQGGN